MPQLRHLGVEESIRIILAGLPVPITTGEGLLLRPSVQIEQESSLTLQQVEDLKFQVAQHMLPSLRYPRSIRMEEEEGENRDPFHVFNTALDLRVFTSETSQFLSTGLDKYVV